jgi:hypothetical protein
VGGKIQVEIAIEITQREKTEEMTEYRKISPNLQLLDVLNRQRECKTTG